MRPLIIAAALALTLATPALADPCKAVGDTGKLPDWLTPTLSFSGLVRYVGDGDSLCVGDNEDPLRWIEVRLRDFRAAELHQPGGREAKSALRDIALGKPVECRAEARSFDRLVATCTLDGVPLGDRLRAAGVPEGGN